MQSGEAALTAASVPRTVTPHAPGGGGLIHAGSGGSMSLADRLKHAALASSLGVGKAPADREPGAPAAFAQAALLTMPQHMAAPGPGSPMACDTVKAEHSSSGSGDFGSLLRGDGSGSAAGGQGLADITRQALMKRDRALMEADAALVRSALGASSGFPPARGGSFSPPPAGRLLRAGTQTTGRSLGGTQSMPHNLNVRCQCSAEDNTARMMLRASYDVSCESTYPVRSMLHGEHRRHISLMTTRHLIEK